MAVYLSKDLKFSDPSDNSNSEDDDVTYFIEQPENQPTLLVTMIKDMLNSLFDRAWEIISKHEKIKRNVQTMGNIPVLHPTKEIKLPGRTNCIVCSDDGVYLFLGHTNGLSVIKTSTHTCVRTWQDESVELTSISCASLGNSAHLLCTVDDMGIARLFAHHMESIYLIKVINETDDINQRHICTKFEVSRSGDFGAATMASSGSVGLDVYRFPHDMWLKELETKQAAHTLGATEAKLSPIALIMKLKPSEVPAGTSLKSPLEVLQKTEGGAIIGSGQNHLISSHQWKDQDIAFGKMFRRHLKSSPMKSQQKVDNPSSCTYHFLLREGFSSMHGGVKQTSAIPIAMCLWWSGSNNLLQYFLLKNPKEKAVSEPKPDVLWPNSQEILCSAVSDCTRFIVLGLATQLVTIWDRRFGCPCVNIVIPGDGAICRLKLILDSTGQLQVTPLPQGPFSPRLQLLISCRSGACYSVTAGRDRDTCIVALIERPAESGSFVSVAEPVPFLECLVLMMQRNGQISVRKMEDGIPVCSLILPQSHKLGSVWEPVCALETVLQNLYIRGDKKTPEARLTDQGEGESSLFMFSFSECSVMEPYQNTKLTATKETKAVLLNLEEACNLYFQERVETLEERNRNLAFQWKQLQNHFIRET